MLETIPESERAKDHGCHEFESSLSTRVLGVQWKYQTDEFVFDIQVPQRPLTRRGLLSAISSLFDPLGFVAPVTLFPKLLLQDLCKQGRSWDKLLNEDEADDWKKWLRSLPHLSKLQIKRCLKPIEFKANSYELHFFSDASLRCYGSCCYLRMGDSAGHNSCSFIIGKARVAPLKAVSIPRLELTAAVLSVRLYLLVTKELDLPNCNYVFWTDSTATLQCIQNNTKQFPVFVANRLAIICEHTSTNSWKYVPSKLNPADFATRGISAELFSHSHAWLQGPSFLWKTNNLWPAGPPVLPEMPSEFCVQKDRFPKQNSSFVTTTLSTQTIDCHLFNELIKQCSSLLKLKRIVAWLLRFKQNVLSLIRGSVTTNRNTSLSVTELENAELELIKQVQKTHFFFIAFYSSPEVDFQRLPRTIKKLCPIIINGILRVGGRLDFTDLDFDLKHPIILPNDSHFTELLIRQCHSQLGHCGHGHPWSILRQRYWMLKGGAAVKRTIGYCIYCKKRNASIGKQLMADLPSDRLQIEQPPFSHVGIDYFGPFNIRQARSTVKRYGCVFTCLTVRAIHIEVAYSMSTDSFLCVLRKFIARRGKPQRILSDNGASFVGAARVLRDSLKELNQQQIHDFLLQKNIEWRFNPPTASYMGGAWERMIRSIRRIFGALLKGQTLTDELLTTLMAEVEGIINSRPLVPVTMDPEFDEPLTPNHLLLLRGNPNLPPGIFDQKESYGTRRWAQSQYLAQQFWSRWIKEFLPNLAFRQKWFKSQPNMQKNDVVLLVDDTQHWSKWHMGLIIDTYPDRKGKVRAVLVKVKGSLIKRPVHKLCVISQANELNSQP